MSNLAIFNLSITRFRSLKNVELGPFGQVNLITGKNNSSKSSLLEAIRILASGGSPETFHKILSLREESGVQSGDIDSVSPLDQHTIFSGLFTGFPNLHNCVEPFELISKNQKGDIDKKVSVKIGWYSEESDPQLGRKLIKVESSNPDGLDLVPILEIENQNRRRLLRINGQRTFRRAFIEGNDPQGISCIFLDPSSSKSTGQFDHLWDLVALTDAEVDVIQALRIISPDLNGVSMIASEVSTRSRIVIGKSDRFPKPIPLKTFGDGVNRLFGIILSLVCAKGGILLVDEIENGMHYSVQSKIWTVIFELARKYGVQVFATTHSWDCIKSFQNAASLDESDGKLIRLTFRNDNIIATNFNEDDLKIATSEQIELR